MQSRLRQIQALVKKLPEAQQQSLLDFAEFLSAGKSTAPASKVTLNPESIARPPTESVVAAIKRLKQTYYMLDTDTLINQVSALMGEHMLQGREASSVIDELQNLFQEEYEEYSQ